MPSDQRKCDMSRKWQGFANVNLAKKLAERARKVLISNKIRQVKCFESFSIANDEYTDLN